VALRPLPVPPELWQRLARLDARCDFDLRRQDAHQPGPTLHSGWNYERQWRVQVWPRGEPQRALTVLFGALEPTLRRAVEMAEANGWAQVTAPAPTRARP
jgi:hypothetical protein